MRDKLIREIIILFVMLVSLSGCNQASNKSLYLFLHQPKPFELGDPIKLEVTFKNLSKNEISLRAFLPESAGIAGNFVTRRQTDAGYTRKSTHYFCQTRVNVNRVSRNEPKYTNEFTLKPPPESIGRKHLDLKPNEQTDFLFNLKECFGIPPKEFDSPGEFRISIEYLSAGTPWEGKAKSNEILLRILDKKG